MKCLNFPMFITWNITSSCNLRCKHCFREEYDCEMLTKKQIDEFINLFAEKEVTGIILTGGEPLKSKHFFYILKKLNNRIKVGIATNGLLLTKKTIEKIISYNVKDFQISLDGATAKINDYIRGEGVFEKVIKNIKLLKTYNCNITIAMTVNSYNYNDILNNSLNLIKLLNLKKLRIEYFIPTKKNTFFNKVDYNQMAILCDNLKKKNKENVQIQIPSFDNKIGCGAGIYNCVLNSDLSISPCDLLTHKYKTGEIKEISNFEKYWLTDKTLKNWRKKINCLNCENEYKCIAMEENDE